MATLVTNRVIQDGTVNYEDLAPAALRILNPPGAVMSFAMSAAPDGWLPCNGAAISRTAYAPLFSAIRTTFGIGDGANTFNLPDLRGEFIRGWAENRAVDTGRVFGSSQNATRVLKDWFAVGLGRDAIGNGGMGVAPADWETGTDVRVYDANETGWGGTNIGSFRMITDAMRVRPRNIALLYCIKF
jgi:phage-related tail fiber protein